MSLVASTTIRGKNPSEIVSFNILKRRLWPWLHYTPQPLFRQQERRESRKIERERKKKEGEEGEMERDREIKGRGKN